ncbi:MAG: ABC transporter permease [Clostridiales Family XIII bacterium]|jgi:hypothetical protein|nr:ABC transporter permease [Clostridiales Family XIII bacterium]
MADESEAKLTYEKMDSAQLKTTAYIDSALIGTNHFYDDVMGYSMTTGSFFTKAAQDEKRKVAVLNETLAFDAFGNFDIAGGQISLNGETYSVVGIIKDGRADNALYVPAVLNGTSVSNVMEVFETEEKTIADLKSIGVREASFYMVNLDEFSKTIRAKFWFGLWILLFSLAGLLSVKALRAIGESSRKIKCLYRDAYYREIIKTREAGTFVMMAALAVIAVCACMYAFMQMAAILLGWNECAGSLDGVPALPFNGRIEWLRKLSLYSNIVFALFLGGAGIGVIGAFKHKQNLR